MDSPKATISSATPGALQADLTDFFYRADEDGPAGTSARRQESRGELRELLVFALAAEHFAIDVPRIQEIVMPPPLSDVPRARKGVLGVTMIRGSVVPVFDIRARLALPAAPAPGPQARVVVVEGTHGPFGLWVDRVEAVVRLAPESLEAPPAGIGGEGELITAIGRRGAGLFAVLDVEALLPSER